MSKYLHIAGVLLAFLLPYTIQSQEVVHQTFKDTRVINSQSVETLRKGILDFRIGHRFGDVNGGWSTLVGLENAADVLFEFDYGLTDNLMIGIMRTKGAGSLKQNVSGLLKYRILSQGKNGPFSMAFSGLMTISTMEGSQVPGRINFFEKFAHRMSYHVQVIFASKISERLSLQVLPQLTYRNYVQSADDNAIPSISSALKFQMNKSLALILDSTISFSEYRNELNANGEKDFYYPFGVGLEWETGGGHVFQINLTNATGIVETDYIPYTTSSWAENEFRLGFTIARQFKL